MKEKFLPIGTVVLLKNALKPVMIIGFCMGTKENTNVMYDYCGVMYPEGMFDSDKNLFFNHDSIDKILFMGYESELETQFKQKLNSFLKENNNAK